MNIDREFEQVTEYWSPRVVADAKGTFIIRYRDGQEVVLNEGDFHVVRQGVEHMTAAPEECWVIFRRRRGTPAIS